jgi:hypothetical protein
MADIADTLHTFPSPCVPYQDTGYQGYTPPNVTLMQPIKKPGGKELSKKAKKEL